MYLRSTLRAEQGPLRGPLPPTGPQPVGPQLRRSKVQVVYYFGREDHANWEALQRLAASVTRFLDPDAALAAADGLEFTESRPLGGAHVPDALWSRLEIRQEMRGLGVKGRRPDDSAERVLFALAANRALVPSSKLAAARRRPARPAWAAAAARSCRPGPAAPPRAPARSRSARSWRYSRYGSSPTRARTSRAGHTPGARPARPPAPAPAPPRPAPRASTPRRSAAAPGLSPRPLQQRVQ